MMLERKEDDHVNLATLPVNTLVKKSIFLRGHQHTVDLKVLENINCEIMAGLDFDDLLEVTTMLHEYDAERTVFGRLDCCEFEFFLGLKKAKSADLPDFGNEQCDNNLVCAYQENGKLLITDESGKYTGELSGKSSALLRHIAHFSHIPPEVITIVSLSVFLVWDNTQVCLDDMAITRLIKLLEAQQNFERCDILEFCITIQTMWEMMQRNHLSYNLFFQQFNVNYVEVALRTIDEKLELFGRSYLSERLMQLDSRQTSQLEIFTKCTMRFYDTLHSLVRLGRKNNDTTPYFSVERLLIYDFETWFLDVIVFWTYSWRDISLKMVARTISLDNDGDASKYEHRPLPAGLYSFLCIQKVCTLETLFYIGLSDDYSMLAFQLSRNMLMGSISLVQILSENIYAYAKKLHNDAMSNDSDMNSRIIRAVNGVEQALLFVSERWRRFVDFDRMATVLPIEEMAVVERFCTKVLDSTRKKCELIMEKLLRIYCRSLGDNIMRIARTVTVENNEHSKKLTMYVRNPAERMYRIMDSVDRLACNACSDLLSSCSQIALRIIREMLETEILRCLRDSRNPEYYSEIYIFQITLKEIINVLGVSLKSSKATPLLHLQSFTTNELILSYYAQIIEGMNVKQEGSVPHINIQVGYVLASGDNALILVNVLGLYNVLELNTLCDRVEPFVKLELLPEPYKPIPQFQPRSTTTLLLTRFLTLCFRLGP
uniref:Gamma-tubulin complex component n=1 Tax=Angiostrongylus cantonensis TaxID=6313 RepID=A0A0K0D1I1_ANGCA